MSANPVSLESAAIPVPVAVLPLAERIAVIRGQRKALAAEVCRLRRELDAMPIGPARLGPKWAAALRGEVIS